ncbi:Endo-1,4-beta-xylanase 5 [Linum grandiflorum]
MAEKRRNSMITLKLQQIITHVHVLLLISSLDALPYDYTASIQCLEIPHRPQYGGGIILNPDLNDGFTGWSNFGNAKLQHRVSPTGNNSFIVAHSRSQPYDSASQKLHLHSHLLYAFSAWIQVSQGSVPVTATLKTSSNNKNGFVEGGAVVAESGCWSMLKGGFTVDVSGEAHLYFHTHNSTADIWVDSISLQPFTQHEWASHQDQAIQQARKGKLRIKVVNEQGNPLPNATVSIQQKALSFPFGCAINKNILTNKAYQNWFTSRGFRVTTFENEMKWYATESSQGKENYSAADSMLRFAKRHNLAVRGHNVLWNDPKYQPRWLNSLPKRAFNNAMRRRVHSVVSRYKGQVIAWDVVNENLHFSFIESKLGSHGSGLAYNLAYRADNRTPLFLNEFNTIEESGDRVSTPARYLQKLREIKGFSDNYMIKFGIGLESHFDSSPNIPYMRASIDTLAAAAAAANVPIWLTEVDVKASPNQANYLEQVLREGYSHPKVGGIVVWAAWNPEGCFRMCLTDNKFRNLATGNVVDKLMSDWGGRGASVVHETDEHGFLETSLFHGEYSVTASHLNLGSCSSVARRLVIGPIDAAEEAFFVEVTVKTK